MMQNLLEKCYWQDVSQAVSAVNPRLAGLIDALDPGKNFPLYKVRYGFGDQIVLSGQFLFPRGG